MKTLLIKLVGSYLNLASYLSKSYAGNKAILLFSTPRGIKITEHQRDFLDTAFKEELWHNEAAIMTYRWLGNKETILLAHGWESNASRWQNLITTLKSKGYNIVALDAPAHGKSGSTSFNAILYSEYINIVVKRFKPSIIIGHSVGGMASALFQHNYQNEHIQKLILLGAPSNFVDVLDRYSNMLGYNQRIRMQMNATIVERFGNHPETYSTAKFLKNIQSKGLIIHDAEDKIIPYNDALQIKDSFKNSTLITTRGLGHSLNNDTIVSHINAFINA